MHVDIRSDEVARNALLHLYNSVIVGAVGSIALIVRMKAAAPSMNPRLKDLQELYGLLGDEGRELFYKAVVSVSEFAVYGTLDFVEQYNRFDAEHNSGDVPRLSLIYNTAIDGKPIQVPISTYGSEELGKTFKGIARLSDVRALVDATLKKVLSSSKS
jgi:hypothetical protein